MSNVYEIASRLLGNIKLTSDNIGLNECYYLCANRQHITDLKTRDHQVVWGRRGTGKTTLLKAFSYEINSINRDPTLVSIYIVMAKVIPTEEEIKSITGDGSSLAIYVFSKMIFLITEELAEIYDKRSQTLNAEEDEKFTSAYFQIQDYLSVYQTYIRGGEYSIERLKSEEVKNEINNERGIDVSGNLKIVNALLKLFRKKTRINDLKTGFTMTGKVQFSLETQVINKLIIQMLNSLGISCLYICLDEYSEMDKVSEFSIQSKVAQLIKQVFFKSDLFSIKIATIWNNTKLHSKGGSHIQGIEYKQDIFEGPDLDIMFMANNNDIIVYFKEVLVNTYFMAVDAKESDKKALSDYLEKQVFGAHGLRQIICGSQGISRSFVILVKTYLQKYIKDKKGIIKSLDLYEMIKQHYIEDVRYKIPVAYSVYKEINKYIIEKVCRYFLITRSDYNRCKTIIKYLASRGMFMQIPGQRTDRRLRDEYKLFVIHYGCYLDALDVQKYCEGRKMLTLDAKLESDGMLVPNYSNELIVKPLDYIVRLPENAENEVYCSHCNHFFTEATDSLKVKCPKCGRSMLKFEAFIDDVAL